MHSCRLLPLSIGNERWAPERNQMETEEHFSESQQLKDETRIPLERTSTIMQEATTEENREGKNVKNEPII